MVVHFHETRIVLYHTDDTNSNSKHAQRKEHFLDLLGTAYIRDFQKERLPATFGFNLFLLHSGLYFILGIFSGRNCVRTIVGDATMAFDPLSSQGRITAVTALRMSSSMGKMIRRKLYFVDSKDNFCLQSYLHAKRKKTEVRAIMMVWLWWVIDRSSFGIGLIICLQIGNDHWSLSAHVT